MAVRRWRRALGWQLTPADGLRLVRADAHPVALFGSWAGGRDVIGAEPIAVRSGPGPLTDILDGSCLPGEQASRMGGARPPSPLAPVPPGAGPMRDEDIGPAIVSGQPTPDGAGPAFGGGWIGYLGYAAGGEALPPSGPRRLPAWWFGYYDHALVRDRATGEWFFEALETEDRGDALERRYADLSRRAGALASTTGYEFGPFRLLPGPAGHVEAVGRAVEYIRQGDIFQANICLRAEASFAGDPLDAFCQAAVDLQPPYASFISVSPTPAHRLAVASLSPELFLRRQAGLVISKPIKGTAGRAADAERAAAQRAGLERSAKNRAENVMIVDLVRNDLARVCEPGSVTVPGLLGVEPHPGVWHLVSTVAGTAGPGVTDGDLIRAAFPPGSVTGAPKVRALEVIDELEISPREVYTGAVGYRSPLAGLELNVAIRTFEFAAGRAWLGAGGGIVADSDPAAEYAECLIKATPLLTAIGAALDVSVPWPSPEPLPRPSAGVFTSLLVVDGQARDLAVHLARLEASVRDLYGKDLPASLRARLSDPGWSAWLAARPTGRLRITVRPVGGPLQATIEVVPLAPVPSEPAAIALRPVTVPGGIGPHKWRDRRLLAELAARAGGAAADQVLLMDETGELLETDRANVFAVIDGVLLTPPADGRLLPGTTRAAVMRAARAAGIRVGQKPLTLDQVAAATEVFVTNAVVGVLPVAAIDGCPAAWASAPGPVTAVLATALTDGLIEAAALTARPLEAPALTARLIEAAALTARPLEAPALTARPLEAAALTARPLAAAAPSARPRPSGRIGAVGRSPRGAARGPLIVLVDNYDSFTWNLAHLLSISGARVEVVRNDEATAAQIAAAGPAGLVISPGPGTPAEAGISIDMVRLAAGVPLLGICLGHQAIAAAFGAAIIRAPRPVHGQARPVRHDGRGLLAGLPDPFQATRYHSLIVDESTLPPELVITARSGTLPMGLRHVSAPVEGVQFHPESILTTHGELLIRTFVGSAAAQLR